MVPYKKVRYVPWLGWLALLLLAVGGGVAYLLHTHVTDPVSRQTLTLILALTVVTAGICLISATADWWIKR